MQIKGLFQKFLNQFVRDLTSFGSVIFFGWILFLVLLFQKFNLFVQLLIGFIFTLIAVILIRLIYFKNRPNKQKYKNVIEKLDASSFPSLHTARTVFISLVFIYFFNDIYLTLFFVLFAISVSFSRVYLKKHDLIDILGGFILGLISFWIVGIFF